MNLQLYQLADDFARGNNRSGAMGVMPNAVLPAGGVQVHFSYVTRKADEVICKSYLCNVIRYMYNINMQDLLLKKQVHDERRKVQSGYGFAFFDNLDDAQLLVKNFKGLTLNGVSYDCSISHRSEHQLNSVHAHIPDYQPRNPPAVPSPSYSSAPMATAPPYLPGSAPYSPPVMMDYHSNSPVLVTESPSLYSPVSSGYMPPTTGAPSSLPNSPPVSYPPTNSPYGYAPMSYIHPRYSHLNSQYSPYSLPYPTATTSHPPPPASVMLMQQRSPAIYHGRTPNGPTYSGHMFPPNPMLREVEDDYAPRQSINRQLRPSPYCGSPAANNPYPSYP